MEGISVFIDARQKPEEIQFNATEMEILRRIDRKEIPLETPLSPEYRAACNRFLELGIVFEGDKIPTLPCGRRAVLVDDDGKCHVDERVERFLKHICEKREKDIKQARKRKQREQRRNAVLANLPAFLRKLFLKDSHLMVSKLTNLNKR